MGAALASGLLLASAFPPMGSSEAAWMALVPLLCVARFSSPAACFHWGFAAGLAFWLPSLAWLLRLSATGGPAWLVGIGWFLLAAYCSLYTGAFLASASLALARLDAVRPFLRGVAALVVLPVLWVGFEYLRATLFTGFPWNALGVSQFLNVPIIQMAAWGGVYAVSALIMVVNSALAVTAWRFVPAPAGRRAGRFHLELALALLLCALCWTRGWRTVRGIEAARPPDPGLRVACVQPAIPQVKKWPEDYAHEIFSALATYTRLAAAGGPDLIVWPETAVPGPILGDPHMTEFVADMAALACPILAGTMEVVGGTLFYNSALIVGAEGPREPVYRKQHLVPFGEYVPMARIVGLEEKLAPLGFTCAAGASNVVFGVQRVASNRQPATEPRQPTTVPFCVLICFEDIFAPLARRAVREGAAFLVNQTNDAWFDGSSGSLQHLSHCVFRAVENRVDIVRAANTGITCLIRRSGHIEDVDVLRRGNWGRGSAGFKSSGVWAARDDRPTGLYTRHGDLLFAFPCGVLAALALIAVVWRQGQEWIARGPRTARRPPRRDHD